jgi:CheY-like chemotaxis protein
MTIPAAPTAGSPETSRAERERRLAIDSQRLDVMASLADGIAHDFRNLLMAIQGHLQLAGQSLESGHEAHRHLRLASEAGNNAAELVNRMLLLARRAPPQSRSRVDLAEMVRGSAGLIAASLPASVALDLDLPGDPVETEGDEGQLQLVLMTLTVAAARAFAGHAGALEVAVLPRGRRAGGGGARVGLVVSRHPPRGDAVLPVAAPGVATGELDLSLVQALVLGLGGELGVVAGSSGEQRTEVWLPAADSGAPTRAAAFGSEPIPGQECRSARILVIDDEPSVCQVLEMALRRKAHRPEVYTSAVDGWARFLRGPADFDLLIVDLVMPDMAGADLIARARGIAPELPVLLMSGTHRDIDPTRVAEIADVTLLDKPVRLGDLWGAVDAALARSGR